MKMVRAFFDHMVEGECAQRDGQVVRNEDRKDAEISSWESTHSILKGMEFIMYSGGSISAGQWHNLHFRKKNSATM